MRAAESWGDLSAGVGVLHDVYPYPQLGNEMMAHIINASRLKIPPLVGGEATHGLQMDDHTIFPSPISLAATWDVDLLKKYGQTVGSEGKYTSNTHLSLLVI
jgi:beta-glucosidase-like glycosyl hydrolase